MSHVPATHHRAAFDRRDGGPGPRIGRPRPRRTGEDRDARGHVRGADGQRDRAGNRPVQQFGRPTLEGGVDWINTDRPIHLDRLRGKIVLLDFWTYCCINCHHIIPTLAKLEEKYKNQLVVIGVHTAKFDAEKETGNIRKKVREYNIRHPVVNDANQVIWNNFDVHSWPTLVLIGPDGSVIDKAGGEVSFETLDRVIGTIARQGQGGRAARRDPGPVLLRAREGPQGRPALPGQGHGRRGRATVSSSPTRATTGSS